MSFFESGHFWEIFYTVRGRVPKDAESKSPFSNSFARVSTMIAPGFAEGLDP